MSFSRLQVINLKNSLANLQYPPSVHYWVHSRLHFLGTFGYIHGTFEYIELHFGYILGTLSNKNVPYFAKNGYARVHCVTKLGTLSSFFVELGTCSPKPT